MIKVLFVCHGNICRSPMAEFVMKDLVKKAGRDGEFDIASAATSSEEIGNPVYPQARRKLAEHGLACDGKRARQFTARDYSHYDLIIGMDSANIRSLRRASGGDPEGKVRLLLSYTPHPRVVADLLYTGDFDAAWNDIYTGCQALLDSLS